MSKGLIVNKNQRKGEGGNSQMKQIERNGLSD